MNTSGIAANRSAAHPLARALRPINLRPYGLAVLSVAVALGLGLFLQQLHFRDGAVPLLLFAVALASCFGGRGPAVLAAILSMGALYWYFVEPVRTIGIYPSEIPYFIIYAAFASLLSWFGTNRRRAEAVLREQASLLDLTHNTVLVTDMEGVIKFWNRGAEEWYGWTAEQAMGRVVDDLLKTVHPAPVEQMKRELTRKGRWEGEFVHTRKDGVRIVVASRWSLERDGCGDPVAILETNNDITERKQAEEALKRSEAYLAEAQRLSHTGSWAFDVANNAYIYLSDECLRIFGLDPKTALPTREAIFRLIHPDDSDRVNHDFRKSVYEKVDTSSEFRIALPTGTMKHIQTTRHPVLNDAGEVFEVVGTVVDITERKRAEEERERLRQFESDLAHLNRVTMMGELAASIAHEVNQPLSGVVSNASAGLRWLAGETPNLEEAREGLRRIVRDGKRAGEVIARIRALTRRTATATEKLDANEIIDEVLPLVGDEAKKKSVKIQTRFAADLAPIAGDRVQLQQVVLNLVINAMEAMSSINQRERELVITTSNMESYQVQVTVEDSGIGIDPEKLEKIFDSFYTTKPGGMGMGLSISRSILQAHGGRLWAARKDRCGTMFHFTLPRYKEEGVNADAARL